MKFLNFNNVLCISPHPDDVEYSMLGTILKYSDTKFNLLQLAQGGDCDESTGFHRLLEVENVWNTAGCNNLNIINTSYKFIKEISEENWIQLIENIIKNSDIKFDAIFLPNDADSHFEHRYVAGFGPALIRNSKISLIQYYTPSTQDAWRSNLYVDIESFYNKKLNALKMFKSQQHRYYFTKDVLRAFHSDFQCSKKKIHYVEKYKILNLFD
jgi:LmbE family N-acetylglucosaminyl deacetylase